MSPTYLYFLRWPWVSDMLSSSERWVTLKTCLEEAPNSINSFVLSCDVYKWLKSWLCLLCCKVDPPAPYGLVDISCSVWEGVYVYACNVVPALIFCLSNLCCWSFSLCVVYLWGIGRSTCCLFCMTWRAAELTIWFLAQVLSSGPKYALKGWFYSCLPRS